VLSVVRGLLALGLLCLLLFIAGDVIDEEVETAVMAMAEERSSTAVSTNFTCGSHFYEEVEDLKDSVWVVQVVRDRQRPFISHRDWKAFVKKVSRFGVQTGIFDCSFDHTLVCTLLICGVPTHHESHGS